MVAICTTYINIQQLCIYPRDNIYELLSSSVLLLFSRIYHEFYYDIAKQTKPLPPTFVMSDAPVPYPKSPWFCSPDVMFQHSRYLFIFSVIFNKRQIRSNSLAPYHTFRSVTMHKAIYVQRYLAVWQPDKVWWLNHSPTPYWWEMNAPWRLASFLT